MSPIRTVPSIASVMIGKNDRCPDHRGFCCIWGEKMEQIVLMAISTVGFPIVVTFYLLTKFPEVHGQALRGDWEAHGVSAGDGKGIQETLKAGELPVFFRLGNLAF